MQVRDEERQQKVKKAIKDLFVQMKTGCKKDICFNEYCVKNPFRKAFVVV
jgi:predicted RNA binding protein with dsRBD fold (UPF0201 family)